MCIFAVPVMKTGRMDMRAKFTGNQDRFCIVAPWSAKIDRSGRAVFGDEPAVGKNVAVCLTFWCGGGSYIALDKRKCRCIGKRIGQG